MKTYTVIFFIAEIGTDREQTGRYEAMDIKTSMDPTTPKGLVKFQLLASRKSFRLLKSGSEFCSIIRIKDKATGTIIFDIVEWAVDKSGQ